MKARPTLKASGDVCGCLAAGFFVLILAAIMFIRLIPVVLLITLPFFLLWILFA